MVDIRTRDEPPSDDGYGGAKVPPNSVTAEAALLGGILHNSRAYDAIYDVVSERDFYNRAHRTIWALVSKQIERNKPADAITILDMADEETRPTVINILHETPSIVRVQDYAKLIREKSILRSLIAAGSEISEQAWEHGVDAQDAAERAEALVLGVLDKEARDESKEPVTIFRAVSDAVDWLETERTAGIATGYTSIDAALSGGGLQPEQLVIIAGRPSMGKSALSYCIAEHAASNGKTVAYFALETSAREIGVRALRWKEGSMGRQAATKWFYELPIVIDDTPAVTLSHIRIRCRRIRRQKGLHLIVVDYLQLMRQRAASRLEEVSEISRGLKAIAKEFECPVIAVCQLNRGVESRPDKRPQLSDLRESGQIEQDADVVMMCYREAYYDPKTPLQDFGEVFIRKNKDGPVADALLRWDGPRTRWIDYTGERPQQAETVVAGDSNKVRAFKPRGAD